MAAADYANVVQQLYVSYFGRPADYYGLQNFEAQLNTMGAPTTVAGIAAAVQAGTNVALVKLVNSFNAAPESVALYGAGTTQIEISKFVADVYTNVLGRPADVAGANWWKHCWLAARVAWHSISCKKNRRTLAATCASRSWRNMVR